MSDWLQCTSGVPQGSILGPILFLIYVNDLPRCILHSQIFLYADDAKLFKHINCRLDCILFQQGIDALLIWCATWQLKLNISKCLCIRYGVVIRSFIDYNISGTVLQKVTSTKDLGVTFDSKLKFSEQYNAVVNQGFIRVNLLLKCFHSCDRNLQIGLYNTFVQPVLEFSSPIWSPHLEKDIKAIERVQKYFMKNLLCLKNLSYHERLCVLKQPSLALRRVRADLIFLYKILHGLVDTDLKSLLVMNTEVVDTHHLRGHALKLYLPKPRTDVLKFSYVYRVVKLWNDLPSFVCESNSLTILKQRLTTHLYSYT